MNNQYRYIYKDATLKTLKNNPTNFYSLPYGSVITSSYPLTSSISFKYFSSNSDKYELKSLKNSFKRYLIYSNHFEYSNSFWDRDTQTSNLINIPSLYYGSSIEKGTVKLDFYVTGTLVGSISDIKKNGELIQTYSLANLNSASVAGVVLYDEGFIHLTASWNLDSSHQEDYVSGTTDYPKWIYFATDTIAGNTPSSSSSYDLSFNGTAKIPTLTMMAHAPKSELNHSNNTTYLALNQVSASNTITGSTYFKEDQFKEIKNITKSPFTGAEAPFEKETFISSIGIYDKDNNLIATAKLAKPVKKTENREITFKLKLDL